ncbi:MAG: PIN domain-containing protein, partial [Terriglobales bacterium]
REALRTAQRANRLVACEVVWAEVRGLFPDDATHAAAMARIEVDYEPMHAAAAAAAGAMWREHRLRHGGRGRVLADFLVGAHALHQAAALLTRDREFYREYFTGLRVICP